MAKPPLKKTVHHYETTDGTLIEVIEQDGKKLITIGSGNNKVVFKSQEEAESFRDLLTEVLA
jgi:hypothetical protein